MPGIKLIIYLMESFLHRHPGSGVKEDRRSDVTCCDSTSGSPSLKAEQIKHSLVSSSFLASLGLFAIGALSIGAFAVGAVAIGRLVLGKLVIRKWRIDKLEIGTLSVKNCECGGNKSSEEFCCVK